MKKSLNNTLRLFLMHVLGLMFISAFLYGIYKMSIIPAVSVIDMQYTTHNYFSLHWYQATLLSVVQFVSGLLASIYTVTLFLTRKSYSRSWAKYVCTPSNFMKTMHRIAQEKVQTAVDICKHLKQHFLTTPNTVLR